MVSPPAVLNVGFEQLGDVTLHGMNSYQLEDHRRKAWLADADADYAAKVDVNISDALIEEGWVAHGDVGMPGTVTGGGVKDPALKKLNEQISHITSLIEIGGYKSKTKRILNAEELRIGCLECNGRKLTAKEKEVGMLLVSTTFSSEDLDSKARELAQLKEARDEKKQETRCNL